MTSNISGAVPPHCIVEPLKVLAQINDAWVAGRPIVPLFGAGLSIDAGIPASSQVAEYLAKVKHLRQADFGAPGEYGSHAARFGPDEWPGFFDVNRLILVPSATFKKADDVAGGKRGSASSDRQILAEVIERILSQLLAEVPFLSLQGLNLRSFDLREQFLYSIFANWRTLLRRLTAGRSSALEAFFENIIANRRPGKGHLFAAGLSRLFGWRLMLTTNVDTLLEDALADIGRRALMLTLPNRGPIDITRDQSVDITLLKLHGNRFSNRQSDILDAVPDSATTKSFLDMLPNRALLLVLGYRGGDERVLHLLSSFLQQRAQRPFQEPHVIWIARSYVPPALTSLVPPPQGPNVPPPLVVSRFSSVTSFLQELYTRLTSSFPASRKGYLATTALAAPRRAEETAGAHRSGNGSDEDRITPTTVFIGDSPRSGSSSALAEFVARRDRTHNVIWIDMEEIHSAEDLIDTLMGHLRSYDPALPHFPSAFGDSDNGALRRDTNRNVERLIEALRRGRYLLALDSMGEFGRSFAAHDLTVPAADLTNRYRNVLELLIHVASRSDNIGESQLAFVLGPPYLPVYAPPLASDTDRYHPDIRETSFARIGTGTTRLVRAMNHDDVTDDYSFVTRVSDPPELPPDCGHMTIVSELGAGGFGRVYRVFDPQLDYTFAFKFFHGSVDSARRDSLTEARRAIRLNHPNIVRVYRVSDSDPQPYIQYDFVDGCSLLELLAKDDFSLRQRVRVLADIAIALSYAHEQIGVAHGDLKPSNILVDRTGRGMLIDFGMGATLRYMSPEQHHAVMEGHSLFGSGPLPFDSRLSDIFSFGCVLFEAATKLNLYDVTMAAPNAQRIPRLREIDSSLPPSLDHICSRCLAQESSDRYRTMRELADALDSWLREDTAGQLGGATVLRHDPKLHALYQNARARIASLPDTTVRIVTPQGVDGYLPSPLREQALERVMIEGFDHEKHRERIIGNGNSALVALQLAWNYLKPQYQAMLAIAAAFRRPRSLVAMRLIGSMAVDAGNTYILALLENLDQRQSEMIRRQASDIGGDAAAAAAFRRNRNDEIDRLLDDLHQAAFLIRQEGGYYWMHAGTRDAIYHSCAQKEPRGMANLHERIADYYYEMVYSRAKDTRAFFEFVFHQVAAFRDGSPDTKQRRLRILSAAFRRERNELLARSHHRALLDCIASLRDHTFKPLVPDRQADESERSGWSADAAPDAAASSEPTQTAAFGDVQSELIEESKRFISLLCDLEADVHRRLTDYRRCVDIRLEQIRHRCYSLGLRDGAGVEAVTESVTRILERPSFVSRPLADDGETQPSATSLGDELWSRFYDLCQKLPRDTFDVANPLFRRLLGHFFDIGISFAGLHCHDEAKQIFNEILCLLDSKVPRPGGTFLAGRPIAALSQAMMNDEITRWVNAMRCHASLRIMESWNSQVYTWPHDTLRREATEKILGAAELAAAYLGMLSDRNPDQYVRNISWLKTLMARAHYLNERFEQAHFLLDGAVASVDNATGVKARLALALCDLRRAECHMLQSDSVLRGAQASAPSSRDTATDLGGASGYGDDLVNRTAITHLMLASDAVRRVKNLIADETGHVWLWTLLYLEEAQLRHEEVLFSLGHQDDRTSSDARERRGWLIRQGLASTSAGIDNIAKDRVRWRHFRALWWQYFVCLCFDFPRRPTVECWEFYRQLNSEAGLGWYWSQKSAESVKRALQLIGERRAAFFADGSPNSAGRFDRQRLLEIEGEIAT